LTRIFKYLITGLVLVIAGAMIFASQESYFIIQQPDTQVIDSADIDTLANTKAEGPQFKLKQDPAYPVGDMKEADGIQLKQPNNLKSDVQYDPGSSQYKFTNKIGNIDYRRPSYMGRDEYKKYELRRTVREYWKAQANGGKSNSRGFKPAFSIGSEAFQKVFGGSTISIIPQGQAELIFGGNVNTTNNPLIQENLRTVWSFNFEEKIQMNVTGTIGERLKLGITYNTDATFEFENKTKLEYAGDEDDIVKKIEAGDVTLPLPGTLITGSQSLFGIKTEMQFGKLNMTTVLSQQRGQTQVIQVQGGAQVTPFELAADEYEANKHFFLTHAFHDNYDKAHIYLPRVASPYTITRIEVWVTNRNKAKVEDVRAIYAFTDLGEIVSDTSLLSNPSVITFNTSKPLPSNEGNSLYSLVKDAVRSNDDRSLQSLGLRDGVDYDKIKSARKLTDNEFSFDRALGYISLNASLNNDEVLGVAFEYMVNGVTYKVGELSTDITSSKIPLVLKMLKGTSLSPSQATWRLMMKNIYSLNAYDVSNEEFYLNVQYRDDSKGTDVNFIPETTGKINETLLLRMLNLDKVNSQMQDNPDGLFDFIDGVTIDKKYGRIIFPMLEPFGSYLDKTLGDKGLEPLQRRKYIYQELYDSTKTKAQLVAEKNKYKLKGSFKSSSSSEIYLNAMNVPQGSVKVTSGGMPLVENQDYVVDYALGTVKIVNSAVMSSGQPIKVSLENNSMFNIQTKTLIGTHLDYKISDDFNIGATIMNLNERPLTTKVNIGDEPISNTIWGLNSTYRTNSQFLTTLVDKLPLLQTKETSTITLTGEFAQLIPGSSSAIGKNGVAYIDDFEGSETKYDLKQFYGWTLASTPQGTRLDGELFNDLAYGYNRAKISWYSIDQSFYRDNSYTPTAVKNHKDWLRDNRSREVFEQELFPNKQTANGVPTNIYMLNLTFYPNERGPYNFTPNMTNRGNLANPEASWGGMMRSLQTNDFEAANIEYIEFWMMDPFYGDTTNNSGGEMYFNLGDISEDILKDGKMAFEHGLPAPGDNTPIAKTVWGHIADTDPLTQSFTNGAGIRQYQDIGLDGLNNSQEADLYGNFISQAATRVDGDIMEKINADPSADNFRYFRDATFTDEDDIVARYKDYNGVENNSPEAGTSEAAQSNYSTPDMEDINNDNTLSDKENYYEYAVNMSPGYMQVGENYIVGQRESQATVEGKKVKARWLQFKIPIQDYRRKVGDIEDFKSIRFIRMYMRGFNKPTTFRFATLDLVRGEWRKYLGTLLQGGESLTDQPSISGFDIQAINIEENANYVLPPGIDRVIDPNQQQVRQLNEQSMVLKVTDLAEGDARAAFKTAKLDMRQYKKMKMATHCEALNNQPLENGEITVFVRLGSDYKGNYYEYEVPMKVSAASNKDANNVWPAENQFDISLDLFQRVKQARNDALVPMQNVYSIFDEKIIDGKKQYSRVSVCGNPTLSDIRTIMIGVRNPSDKDNKSKNDGLPKSAEVWVNELRLTDFSDKGGWAANSRAQVKLADFGNLRISGATMQPGFGSIEKKVNDREKVETNQFDASADAELGKFFPEKAQVKIPVYASYSVTAIKPQYNPLDPDIPLQAALDNAPDTKTANIIEENATDRITRRSINFTNVKVNKMSKTPQLYDPANFSVSYGYNDEKAKNYTTVFKELYHNEGSINYIFNNRPKNVVPFQKVKFLNGRAFRIIKDFNFYYAPTSFSFRTNMLHDHRRTRLKDLASKDTLPLMVERNWLWNRLYDVKYDLSRSLKIDFNAKNVSRIDEWNSTMAGNYEFERRHERGEFDVWKQIENGGHNINYNQQININYNVPINKLPLLEWITMSTRYGGTFEWQRQPAITIDTGGVKQYRELGHNISNSRTLQINSNISLSSIYSKISFLKDLQSNQRRRGDKQQGAQQKEMKTVKFEKDYFSLKAGVPKSISHKLGSQDVTIKVTDAKGAEVKGKMEVISANRLTFSPDTDVTNVHVVVEGKVEAGTDILFLIGRNTLRILTGVKSISGSYTQTEGTALPGYLRTTKYVGMSGDAPGYQFVWGDQRPFLINQMTREGWLAVDTMLSGNLMRTNTKTLSLRLNFEPFDGLRIDLTANHSKTNNRAYAYLSSYNDIREFLNQPREFQQFANPTQSGNLTMSIIAIGSIEPIDTSTYKNSKPFNDFKAQRIYFRDKLMDQKRYTTRYYQSNYWMDIPEAAYDTTGFTINSQQVLITSFLATYAGYGNKSPLYLFPKMGHMRPNWRINYDGLINFPYIKDYFQSVNLTHAYSATYSIGSYMSNSKYSPDSANVDQLWNFTPEFDVSSVSISEQFSPWFGIDVTLKNNVTARFEYKKSRMIMLGITNYSVSETHSKEYVIGTGYRFPDIPLTMITFGAVASPVKSDLNLRADLSIRDDINILRRIDISDNKVTQGNTNYKLSLSADYQLSDRLTVRFFFDRMLTTPHISTSFETINTDFGFSIRFTLAQ
jgi:cell surface protein SprA